MGIPDGPHSEHHVGKLPTAALGDLRENVLREVGTVCELDHSGAATSAGANDLERNLGVGVVKNRYETRVDYGPEDLESRKTRHERYLAIVV